MSNFYFNITHDHNNFKSILECIKTFEYKGNNQEVKYKENVPYGTRKQDITGEHRQFIMNHINEEILKFKLDN